MNELTDIEHENTQASTQEWMDDLVTRINARIADLEKEEDKLQREDVYVLEQIKKTLSDHNIPYVYDPRIPERLTLPYSVDNKTFQIHIFINHMLASIIIHLRLIFPIPVQCNSLALVALHIARFNADKGNIFPLNLNMNEGSITSEYNYFLNSTDAFDSDRFGTYLRLLIQSTLKEYTQLHWLAVGKVSRNMKDYYESLLEMSLNIIHGEEEDENNIIYGFKNLERSSEYDCHSEFRKWREEHSSFDPVDIADLSDKDEMDELDNVKDFDEVHIDHSVDERDFVPLPSFEEYMHERFLNEQGKEKDSPFGSEEAAESEDAPGFESDEGLLMPFEEVPDPSEDSNNE